MPRFTHPPAIDQRCPSCGAPGTRTIESRVTAQGRRRRHQCSSCSSRFTTHEIGADLFDQLMADSATLHQLRSILRNDQPATASSNHPQPAAHCITCVHGGDTGRCDLTLPEAFTPAATDCPYHRN